MMFLLYILNHYIHQLYCAVLFYQVFNLHVMFSQFNDTHREKLNSVQQFVKLDFHLELTQVKQLG